MTNDKSELGSKRKNGKNGGEGSREGRVKGGVVSDKGGKFLETGEIYEEVNKVLDKRRRKSEILPGREKKSGRKDDIK